MTIVPPESRLQQSLDEVTRLLDRHRVLETLTHRQEGPKRDLLESLQHRQNLVELHKRLRTMHPADVAFVLDTLPPDDRATVWDRDPGRTARASCSSRCRQLSGNGWSSGQNMTRS